MTVQPTGKLTQFSLIEEIKIAYRDLEVITSRTEYRDKEKQIIEMESRLAKSLKENCNC